MIHRVLDSLDQAKAALPTSSGRSTRQPTKWESESDLSSVLSSFFSMYPVVEETLSADDQILSAEYAEQLVDVELRKRDDTRAQSQTRSSLDHVLVTPLL